MTGMPAAPAYSYRAYFRNIAWSWFAVIAVVISGTIFVPILIRRLGDTTYGIWTLAVSLVEYFWMIDLGLRPATVKYTAEYRALGRTDAINRLLNTALAYSVTAGLVLMSVALFAAEPIAALLRVTDPNFPFLIRMVGVSWAAGLAFNIFSAILDGFNRFDLSNRSGVVAAFLRAGLSVALVVQGYGLREMGIALVISQVVWYAMVYYHVARVWPEMRLSPKYIDRAAGRTLFGYARQIVPAVVGGRITQGTLPAVIAFFTSTAQVTYFTQTQRIMDYASELVARVGLITTPRAADMYARGQHDELVALASTTNRYCVTLWGLVGSFMFVYGADLCRLWVDPEFGDRVAPLLPLFVAGYTFWLGQFISASVLMGIAVYTRYATTLLIEALSAVAAVAVILPVFGLPAAVAAVAVLIVIARCLVLSYLFCKHFGISQSGYLARIFTAPLMLIGGSIGGMLALRYWAGPADSWIRLIGIGVVFCAVYIAAAGSFIVSAEHRNWFLSRTAAAWMRFRTRT